MAKSNFKGNFGGKGPGGGGTKTSGGASRHTAHAMEVVHKTAKKGSPVFKK